MALLSRPSLRGSVRRAPEEPADGLAPPTKKPRIQENGDRRKSSPDCLDTKDPTTANVRANSPLKPSRPRASNRTRRDSSSSVDSRQWATPATRTNGNGSFKTPRARRDQGTPSGKDLLRDLYESPDPLDTISPAPSVAKPRTATPANLDSKIKPPISPVTRTTRRNENRSLTDADENAIKEEGGVDGATPTRGSKSKAPDVEQPASEDKRSERRSLRSTDTGLRCKSELAQYFHNYEQIISLEDPEPEFLAAKTTITLVEDLSQPPPFSPKPDPTPFGNPLLKLYDCEKITLPKPVSNKPVIDPLGEDIYFRAHRKFERQEKQLRNIERNRAQHEQQVLERLLDELRGHDWLRVMGLTGVHESDKKLYEPKRHILIQELVALVNKFQAWKDEERRRKLEKEKAHPVPGTEVAPNALPRQHSRKRSRPVEDVDSFPAPVTDLQSTPDAEPDPSDVDALAARQLHEEARSAGAAKLRKTTPAARKPISNSVPNANTVNTNDPELKSTPTPKRKKPNPTPTKPLPQPPTPTPIQKPARPLQQAPLSYFWNPAPRGDGPFTSFFRQRHVREAAIAATKGIRRGGSRSTLAFGYPVPDQTEREFELPPDILNEDSIQQSQRKRRRLKRGSLGG
ncbi:uncharacterized protein N7479_001173 [Penicillium vulpinum]|uniref:Something about silencing protein 4 domain-containing protein n=1 Tax=Penicillium vulpinum TaxID=29845 RepID=A0A1V6R9C9_9EURO|nr:uncharacterized protein N7479_001173 [Penicillium vulpinum]KAJ5971255.1 hypothetical protein N7479_001173 [Penicillium vulpinum]OQD97846.1 hypothetical protein PENVUL_c081G01271 [Penicillium vulpinum]